MLTSKTQADVLDALCALAFAAESPALTAYDRMLLSQSVAGARRAIAAFQAPAAATLAIVVEGGMISAIVSDRPELFADIEVLVIDYDTDGNYNTTEGGFRVPQSDGTEEDARVEPWPVDRAKIDLAAVVKEMDERDNMPEGWRLATKQERAAGFWKFQNDTGEQSDSMPIDPEDAP